jgi:hypothetical protein
MTDTAILPMTPPGPRAEVAHAVLQMRRVGPSPPAQQTPTTTNRRGQLPGFACVAMARDKLSKRWRIA